MNRAPSFADASGPLAILVSGGLDSAVLLAESVPYHTAVFPLYVRFGLIWEKVELEHLHHFLQAIAATALRPLHILDMPVADLYGQHWSLTGHGVPAADSSDEAVFLPGRNVLLLSKALLWCHLNSVPNLALAPLQGNPFPDATPAFFRDYQAIVNQSVGGAVHVHQPYLGLDKVAVLKRGRGLPLELTFSCIHPQRGQHCGECNKCAERRRAFATSALPDPTAYARSLHV